MEKSWSQIDLENQQLYEKQMEDARKKNAADRDFFGAALYARRSTIENDLLPIRDQYGELRYTVRQGLKAACHAREDIAANLVIQRSILQRLDRARHLSWVCVALLVYIAYRLTSVMSG